MRLVSYLSLTVPLLFLGFAASADAQANASSLGEPSPVEPAVAEGEVDPRMSPPPSTALLDPQTPPFASRFGYSVAGAAVGGVLAGLGGALFGYLIGDGVCAAQGPDDWLGCFVPHVSGSLIGAGAGLLLGTWVGTLVGGELDPGLAFAALGLALLTAVAPAAAAYAGIEAGGHAEQIYAGATIGALNLMVAAPLFALLLAGDDEPPIRPSVGPAPGGATLSLVGALD